MRVLAHVDLDAFYTQVEAKRNPRLKGTPLVVIQYNPYGDLRTLKPSDNRIFPESNGSIIAVSYEARKHGVKRNMMAQQAKKLCPELNIVQVPVAHGKADLTIYREAGAAVISILSSRAICERASIDEAYLDVTAEAQQLLASASAASGLKPAAQGQQQSRGGSSTSTDLQQEQHIAVATAAGAPASGNASADASSAAGTAAAMSNDAHGMFLPLPTNVDGWHIAAMEPGAAGVADWWSRPADQWSPDEQLLAAGAVIVAQLRAAVAEQLGFSCSAGVAHSKILAKLGSGLNKPAQQTLVPAAAVQDLLNPLPISKLRQLGGKFGEEVMQGLGVSTVGELSAVPMPKLEALVGLENAAWLARLAQGLDDAEVKPRTLPKSISCGKTFRGGSALTGLTAVHTWLKELATELQERVEADRRDNQRMPSLLTVSVDTLAVDATAAAAAGSSATDITGAVLAAAAAGTGSTTTAVAAGPRATPQNWRAGVVSFSRSTALRRPVADIMADDALKLVKRWARDRGQGWKIIGMFITATNFVAAPTGASTLNRFLTDGRQQQQSALGPAAKSVSGQHNSAVVDAGKKRSAADASLHGSSSSSDLRKTAKCSSGGLRAFLTHSQAAVTAAEQQATQAASAVAQEEQQQQQQQHSICEQIASVEHVGCWSCDALPTAAKAGTAFTSGAVLDMPKYAQHQTACDAAAAACADSAVQHTATGTAGLVRRVLTDDGGIAVEADGAATAAVATFREPVSALSLLAHARSGSTAAAAAIVQDGAASGPQLAQQLDRHHEQFVQMGQQLQHVLQPATEGVSDFASQQLQISSSEPSQSVVASLCGWLGSAQQQQQQGEGQQLAGMGPTHQVVEIQIMPEEQHRARQRTDYSDIVLAPTMQQQHPQQQDSGKHDAGDSFAPVTSDHGCDAVETSTAAAAAGSTSSMWQAQQLHLSDIDPDVLSELPVEIQLEVRRAARGTVGSYAGQSSSRKQAGKHGKPSRGSGKRQSGVQKGAICKYFNKPS